MFCYLCHSKRIDQIRDKIRHNIRRPVLKCRRCQLVFLAPQKSNLNEFYNKEYRKLYTPVLGKKVSTAKIHDLYLPFQQYRIKDIKYLLKPKIRLLDIGCSHGAFLAQVKKYVKECVGLELNKAEAKFVRNKLR